MNIQELIKNRSITSCISAGYNFWSTNLNRVFIKTWQPLVATAICAGLLVVSLMADFSWSVTTLLCLAFFVALVLYLRFTLTVIHPCPSIPSALRHVIKHWWNLSSLALLSGSILLLIACITCLPLCILIYASYADHANLQMGDPSSIGYGFYFLAGITTTVTVIILLYVQSWQTFAACYLYGSWMAKDHFMQHKE